jgi:hypothetical protein
MLRLAGANAMGALWGSPLQRLRRNAATRQIGSCATELQQKLRHEGDAVGKPWGRKKLRLYRVAASDKTDLFCTVCQKFWWGV